MKIEKNTAIYVGNAARTSEEQGKDKQRKSIFAGELQPDNLMNRIEQKKEKAKEKAMKLVKDAREGDRAMDADLEKRRATVKELQQENHGLQEQVDRIVQEQERLETLGDTAEDRQEYAQALQEDLENYQELIDKNKQQIKGENQAISSTQTAQLKYAPVEKAGRQAEEIMEAASQEIIGMVMEDAKSHIDEENEKRQEQAEEIKEEKELQEKRAEKKEEREELMEDIPVDEIIRLSSGKTELQKEVQAILDEMKLIAEDIKGVAVDTEI